MAGKAKFDFQFLQHEAAGGVLLCAAALLAMAAANSAASPLYNSALETVFRVGTEEIGLSKSVLHWINDGLMVIFFFLVGLEIKREFLVGALSSAKSAALPVVAAIGGMVVPAAIYAAINWGDAVALRGAAIPAATDIAFAIGVLALLGSRIPAALKIFLLALAIIDDLGAIIIIAIFYTSDLSMLALSLAAAGVLLLIALNRSGVERILPYLLAGLFVWVCVLKSGVHATLAGVVTALSIPLRASEGDGDGPLERLEHALAPWVSFGILPIFAFANAGVSLAGISVSNLFDPIPLGIILGLFLGKPLGIYAFARASVAAGVADMPDATTRVQLFGAGVIAGIGFTMSLFVGMLAFVEADRMTEVRLGVIAGSILSGIVGYLILASANRPASGTLA